MKNEPTTLSAAEQRHVGRKYNSVPLSFLFSRVWQTQSERMFSPRKSKCRLSFVSEVPLSSTLTRYFLWVLFSDEIPVISFFSFKFSFFLSGIVYRSVSMYRSSYTLPLFGCHHLLKRASDNAIAVSLLLMWYSRRHFKHIHDCPHALIFHTFSNTKASLIFHTFSNTRQACRRRRIRIAVKKRSFFNKGKIALSVFEKTREKSCEESRCCSCPLR